MILPDTAPRAKYGLAITNALLDAFGPDIGLGYDIGCGFDTSALMVKLIFHEVNSWLTITIKHKICLTLKNL